MSSSSDSPSFKKEPPLEVDMYERGCGSGNAEKYEDEALSVGEEGPKGDEESIEVFSEERNVSTFRTGLFVLESSNSGLSGGEPSVDS